MHISPQPIKSISGDEALRLLRQPTIMATWNASSSSHPAASPSPRRLISYRRRTKATPPKRPSSESPPRKMRSIVDIMAKSTPVVFEQEEQDDNDDSYGDVTCEKCDSGDRDDELLLCDKCDKGFHMKCLRPIVVRVPVGPWVCVDCSDQRPVRSRHLFFFPFFFKVPNFCMFSFVKFFIFLNVFRFVSEEDYAFLSY